MKTSELSGGALDWAVAECENNLWLAYENALLADRPVPPRPSEFLRDNNYSAAFAPSTDWAQGGPIIEREGISTIKLEHEYGVDSEGYTTTECIPVFGAVVGEYFDTDLQRNSYGESYGEIYYIGTELVTTGPTLLIAAMRCFVSMTLGNEVEIPKELL